MSFDHRCRAAHRFRGVFDSLPLLLGVVMLALVSVAQAGAQTVKGVLTDETTGAVIAGAYIVLLNVDSVAVTRELTNPLGRFTVHAPRPGTYRVRTERIGYKSVVSDVFELTEAEDFELELRVVQVVLELDLLTIEGGRECRVIGDQALQVLTVWEEARKALTAVAWTGPGDRLIHELERFERWYTPNFRMVHEIRDTMPTHNVMPFLSRSVEELEEVGYVVVLEDSVLYEAPDANVFFSGPFLQHHCFRLEQRRRNGTRMIGLRFEPVPGRDMPDVAGVFWLDAVSGALDQLEISYVNVGVWQRERGASGELDFERLPDGQWFVSSWWIRMPVVRRSEGMQGPVWQFQEAVVGFKQEGGEVNRVFAPDGRTVYARERATVAGVVFDSTAGVGLAGAYVRLSGTSFVTISRADGSFWLTDLPKGDYTVSFAHPRAVLLGVDPDLVEVDLELGEVLQADLALPPAETVVERACPESPGFDQGLLVGKVAYAESDSLVTGANVRVVWLQEGADPTWRQVITNSQGIYRLCVARGVPLSVEVTMVDGPATSVPAMFGDNPVQVLDIEVRNEQPSRFPLSGPKLPLH